MIDAVFPQPESALDSPFSNADETRIQVIKESSKSINSDKYMWVSLGGPPGQPSVLFEYDPSRSKEIPLRLFEGFSGYLQTDGYASYNAVCKQEGITQAGCFDHVRRKFTDAKKGEAKPGKKVKNARVSKADVALGKIRKLYAIEVGIEKLSAAEKLAIRQEKSKPLLDDLRCESKCPVLQPGRKRQSQWFGALCVPEPCFKRAALC